jgi:hypothetical protein
MIRPKDANEMARFSVLLNDFGRLLVDLHSASVHPAAPARDCSDAVWREWRLECERYMGTQEGLSLALAKVGEVQTWLYAALREPSA